MSPTSPNGTTAGAPSAPASHEDAGVAGTSGDRLGAYELFEVLGRGAATVVRRARHLGYPEVDLAVKVAIDPRPEDLERVTTEFRREAALLASIGHEALPTIHEVGSAGGRPFLAMERIAGRPVADRITDGPLTESELLSVGIDVAEVLAAMHRRGAVHRDIKPQNLLATPDGRTRVIDVGLATWAADGAAAAETLAGTFIYSAPEQTGMFSRAVDGRADLYSLGVVLFECATGAPPFTAVDVGELLHQHASQAPPDLRALRPDLAPALCEVILRLLAKDADDRVPSAGALVAALRGLRGDAQPADTGDVALSSGSAIALGRRHELERLRSRWQHVARAGTFALVTGDPGSGRNTLVRTLAAEITAAGGAAAVAACTQGGPPLAPLRAALLARLETIASLPTAEREAATRRLRAAVGETALVLRGLVPSLAEALDPGSGATPPPGGDAIREEDIVLAVVDLLRGIAREEAGLLLALTDTQWLDPLSRRVMRQLAASLSDVPLLVVVTVRADEHEVLRVIREEVGSSIGLTLELAALGPAEAATVVASQLAGAAVPEELTASVVARTEGNPSAIVEYVRALVDAGALRPSWGEWELDGDALERLQLPADVRDLLLARLTRFDEDVRRLLTVAAVQGPRFDRRLLEEVVDADVAQVRAAVAVAETGRIIERIPGGGYVFVHEDVRQQLLVAADPAWVAQLHAAAADAIPADAPDALRRVANHRIAAGPEGDPAAVFHACVAAAEHALDQRLVSEAAEFLDHARRVAPRAGIALDGAFHHTYAQAAFLTGSFSRAREHLGIALGDLHDPLERARAIETLARIQVADHDTDGALGTVRRGLEVLGRPLPRSAAVLAVSSLLRLLLGAWRLRKRRGPSTGRRAQLDELETSLLLVAAGAAAGSLRNSLVVAYDARALLPASRLPVSELRASAIAAVSLVLSYLGQHRRASVLFEAALQSAQAIRSRRAVAAVCTMRGLAEARDGDPAPLAAALVQHGRWLDVGDFVPWTILASSMYFGDGHVTEAERWMARARARAADDPAPTDEAARVLMECAVQAGLGRTGQAVTTYERLREVRASAPATRDTEMFYSWVELTLAIEQEEVGASVGGAIERLLALGLPVGNVPAGWIRLGIATALVARAAERDGAERRALLRRVGRFIRVARINSNPHLRSHLDALAARRAHLLGRERTTAWLLDRASRTARELDQPSVLYSVALQRARILQAGGHAAGARLQARVALALATDGSWELRARRVRTEFGLEEEPRNASRGTHPSSVGGSSRQLDQLQAVRRLEALQEVSAAAATVLDPDQVTEVALGVVLRLLSAERAFVFSVEPSGGTTLLPYRGRDAEGNPLTELHGYSRTLVDRVFAGGEPVIVTGTEEGEALGSRSAVVHGLRSILVAPIEVHGRRTGVLYLDSRVAKGVFTTDDLGLLSTLAAQVAASQETARAAQLEAHVRAARQQRDLADSLRTSMSYLTATLDPEEVLRRALTLAIDTSASERGCLLTDGPDGWQVAAVASSVDGAPSRIVSATSVLGPALVPDAGRLLGHPRPQLGRRDTDGRDRLPVRLVEVLADPVAWLVLPLELEATVIGCIVVASPRDATYDEVAVEVAATLTGQALAAHQTASLFAEVQRLATRDTLTGLANRGHFWHLAERYLAAPGAQRGTAVMLDIDHFKAVNDTHGHAVGDAVLREVAVRLSSQLRPDDLIGRYGGEEFAALLPGDGDGAAVAERLRAAVAAAPVLTEAGPIPVTISVGISRLGPDGDLDEALVRADAALYGAKRAGRDRVGVDGAG